MDVRAFLRNFYTNQPRWQPAAATGVVGLLIGWVCKSPTVAVTLALLGGAAGWFAPKLMGTDPVP